MATSSKHTKLRPFFTRICIDVQTRFCFFQCRFGQQNNNPYRFNAIRDHLYPRARFFESVLPPHHLIDHASVALDDLDHLVGHILIHIIRHRDTQITVLVHLDCHIHGLQQMVAVDACQDEVTLVQCFGAFGAGADADCRERMAHGSKEAALLRQGSGIGNNTESVHLQTVIVVEAQRFVLDDTLVKHEAALLQTLAATGMAGVKDGHIILLRHLINCIEQGSEVLLRVDILFPMGRKQDILSLFQTQTGVDIRRLDLLQILMQYLRHRRTSDVGALFGQARIRQIAAGMLGVGHIHIGDDIHNAAVGLLRQALILAAVAGFHVEDGNVQPLGPDDAQAAVGVAQYQNGVRLDGHHQLIALGDNIAHGFAQVRAHGIHVDLRACQLQIMEEHAVQVVVVVLPGMRQNHIEIFARLVDDGSQANNLRAGTHDDQQLQLAVILKGNVTIISHCFSPLTPAQRRCPGASGQRSRCRS